MMIVKVEKQEKLGEYKRWHRSELKGDIKAHR